MRPILPVIAAIFILAACGSGGGSSSANTTISEETPANTAEVGLAPMNGSSTGGLATFTDVAQGVRVDLNVHSLPGPRAIYLTHIHPGTCEDEQTDEEDESKEHDSNDEHAQAEHEDTMEEIEYPLLPITPDPEGRGHTTDVLEGVTVEQLFSGSPKYINVHAEGSGNPPSIACSQMNIEGHEDSNEGRSHGSDGH
jgi:hypothetical protein